MLVFVVDQRGVGYADDDPANGRVERTVELRLIVPIDALAAIVAKITQGPVAGERRGDGGKTRGVRVN